LKEKGKGQKMDPNTFLAAVRLNPYEVIKDIVSRLRQKPREQFIDIHQEISECRSAFSQAAMYYYQNKGSRLLGGTIPLLIKDSWIPQKAEPIENVKLSFSKNSTIQPIQSNNLPEKGSYIDNIVKLRYNGKAQEAPYKNNLCYQLNEIGKGSQFKFSLCNYFDYINTCEYLMYDFIRGMARAGISKLIKGQYDRGIDPFDFTNRYCAPGINTLLLFSDNNKPKMYLHSRSEKVAEGINTKHVVPAGTFQPIHHDDSYHERDFNFYVNIMREFGEEFYGDKDLVLPVNEKEDILKRKSIRKYHYLITQNRAKVFYLGIGLDCLTLKPEILTAIIFKLKDFDELFGGVNLKPNNEGIPYAVDLTRDNLKSYSKDITMLPAGAGCMYQTLQFYDDITNSV
jgi:hypothetical protein